MTDELIKKLFMLAGNWSVNLGKSALEAAALIKQQAAALEAANARIAELEAAAKAVYAAQPTTRVESSDRYFLVTENRSYLIVDRVRSEMRGDEPDYYVLSWTPNKADAQFVCDVMNFSLTQCLETKPSIKASGEEE